MVDAEFQVEPDDLTHLAPAAGDICIPLGVFAEDFAADLLSLDDLLDDEVIPIEEPVGGNVSSFSIERISI